MAEEAVIFPSQPLFMVDRGWQRHKKRSKKGAPFGEMNLQASRVPEVTITVMKEPDDHTSTSSSRGNGNRKRAKSYKKKPVRLQFMSYEPPEKEKKGKNRNKPAGGVKQESLSEVGLAINIQSRKLRIASPILKQSVSGALSPLYTLVDPEVDAFQTFVHYCRCSLEPMKTPTANLDVPRSDSSC